MSIPAEITVREVMTSDPITVTPDTSLRQAIELLANRRIGGLPVIQDDNTLAGVLSEAELMWQESGVNRPPYITLLDSVIFLENPATYEKELHKALGQQVKDVMNQKVVTVAPDVALREAARLMHRKEVPRLVVVDEAAASPVVGIITRGDVIRYMASHQDEG